MSATEPDQHPPIDEDQLAQGLAEAAWDAEIDRRMQAGLDQSAQSQGHDSYYDWWMDQQDRDQEQAELNEAAGY